MPEGYDSKKIWVKGEEKVRGGLERTLGVHGFWDPLLASAECLTENATHYIARREFAEQSPDLVEQLLEQVRRVWKRRWDCPAHHRCVSSLTAHSSTSTCDGCAVLS